MSNFSAIYIHLGHDVEAEFATVQSTLKDKGYLFTLRYHAPLPWVQLWVDEMENTGFYVRQLTEFFPQRRLIGIACQSVSDSIGYWEVDQGQAVRTLLYGFEQERVWETVSGTAQAWELELFAGREGYNKDRVLQVGMPVPSFSNFDVHKLGQLLGLPGFGQPAAGEAWTKEVFS